MPLTGIPYFFLWIQVAAPCPFISALRNPVNISCRAGLLAMKLLFFSGNILISFSEDKFLNLILSWPSFFQDFEYCDPTVFWPP